MAFTIIWTLDSKQGQPSTAIIVTCHYFTKMRWGTSQLLFIEVPAASQETQRSCICVLGVSILLLFWFSVSYNLLVTVMTSPCCDSQHFNFQIHPYNTKSSKNTAVASRLFSLSLDLHIQIVPGMMRVANWVGGHSIHKKLLKKRTKRIFHNILVLTFSLLLQIFRYNVYKCIYKSCNRSLLDYTDVIEATSSSPQHK
jgi:hypothetical protein